MHECVKVKGHRCRHGHAPVAGAEGDRRAPPLPGRPPQAHGVHAPSCHGRLWGGRFLVGMGKIPETLRVSTSNLTPRSFLRVTLATSRTTTPASNPTMPAAQTVLCTRALGVWTPSSSTPDYSEQLCPLSHPRAHNWHRRAERWATPLATRRFAWRARFLYAMQWPG
eukprot:scaffold746_cov112-Isochrysis_galbana.AAC.1